MNIHIIRIFIKLREMLLSHKDILLKLEQLERQVTQHNDEIQAIFRALKQLIHPPFPPRKRIGYKTGREKRLVCGRESISVYPRFRTIGTAGTRQHSEKPFLLPQPRKKH